MKEIIIDGVTYTLTKKEDTPKYKIGDEKDGGIIFHIDKSGEHGLIANKSDYYTQLTWNDVMKVFPQGEWRLPTKEEFKLLYQQKDVVGGFADRHYWSCSKSDNGLAWKQGFSVGLQYADYKNFTNYVRTIRSF